MFQKVLGVGLLFLKQPVDQYQGVPGSSVLPLV